MIEQKYKISRSKIRPKTGAVTPDELHIEWKKSFLCDANWNEKILFAPVRRFGLSKKELQNIPRANKLETHLISLCKKFGCETKKVKKGNSFHFHMTDGILGSFVTEHIVTALNHNRMNIDFAKYCHQTRDRGPVRTIPGFVAEHILIGLALAHLISKMSERHRMLLLMERFFKKEGEFAQWFERTGLPSHLVTRVFFCRGVQQSLSSWAKQFGHEMKRNLEFAGERKIDKSGKRSLSKRNDITKRIQFRAAALFDSVTDEKT